jgi:hypothetical protein
MVRARFALLAAACAPLLLATAAAAQTAIPGAEAVRYVFNTDTGAITYSATINGMTSPAFNFAQGFGNRLNGVQVVPRGVDGTSTRFRWSIQGDFILQADEADGFATAPAPSMSATRASSVVASQRMLPEPRLAMVAAPVPPAARAGAVAIPYASTVIISAGPGEAEAASPVRR